MKTSSTLTGLIAILTVIAFAGPASATQPDNDELCYTEVIATKYNLKEQAKKAQWDGDTFIGNEIEGYPGSYGWTTVDNEYFLPGEEPAPGITYVKGNHIHSTYYMTTYTQWVNSGGTKPVQVETECPPDDEPEPQPLVRVTFFCVTTEEGPIQNIADFGLESPSFGAGEYVFRIREEAGVATDFTAGVGGAGLFSGSLAANETIFVSTDTAVAGVSVLTSPEENLYSGTASTNNSECAYPESEPEVLSEIALYIYQKLRPEESASWENSGPQTYITHKAGDAPEDWYQTFPGELPAYVCGDGWGFQQDAGHRTEDEIIDWAGAVTEYPNFDIGWPPIYADWHGELSQLIEVPECQTDVRAATIDVDFDPRCESGAPWLYYDVFLDDPDNLVKDPTQATITFLHPTDPKLNAEIVVTSLSGRALWPGAALAEDGVTGDNWPGWKKNPDGSYSPDPSNYEWTRLGVTVQVQVNPITSAVVDYPAATGECDVIQTVVSSAGPATAVLSAASYTG